MQVGISMKNGKIFMYASIGISMKNGKVLMYASRYIYEKWRGIYVCK